jgi:FkbM family methyltransferase
MKQALKNILQRAGVYEWLRWSAPFRLYHKLFNAMRSDAEAREKTFYASFLAPMDLIFDIGANDGHKTEAFLTLSERVVACEPDPSNFKILQSRFRSRRKRVVLEQKALGTAPGRLPMLVHHPGSAFNTLNPKFKSVIEADNVERWNEKIAFEGSSDVMVTTLDGLIMHYGVPGFIKIDVEGYELEVVRGLSSAVPCLSLECLFPEFREELEQSREHLRNLGSRLEYNIALYEKLFFPEWLDDAQLDDALNDWKESHFELVVRMISAV